MKSYRLISIAIILFSINCFGQSKLIKTRIIHVSSLQDLYNLDLNFCDTFSLEIEGLYSIISTKDYPLGTEDSSLAKWALIKSGFKQTDWGYGNWDKGPRILHLEFKKGKCNCEIDKKYFGNKKNKQGEWSTLRISERIICNTKMYMDE